MDRKGKPLSEQFRTLDDPDPVVLPQIPEGAIRSPRIPDGALASKLPVNRNEQIPPALRVLMTLCFVLAAVAGLVGAVLASLPYSVLPLDLSSLAIFFLAVGLLFRNT